MEGEEKGGPEVPSGRQPVVLAPPTFPSPFMVADEAMHSDLLRDVQRHSHLLGDSRRTGDCIWFVKTLGRCYIGHS